MRSIFAQPDSEALWAQFHRAVDQLDERFPDAEVVHDLPQTHWKQILSSNPQERPNKEIRRRSELMIRMTLWSYTTLTYMVVEEDLGPDSSTDKFSWTVRNASTTSGSKCLSLWLAISSMARSTGQGSL